MSTSDDGVREIQLSGKQLVFLFMAVTVVSVVIFLCGVLVGRGVQARTAAAGDAAPVAVEEPADPTAPAATPSTGAPAGPTAVPDLGYQGRLEASAPAAEKLVKPTASAAPPPAAQTARPEPAVPEAAGARPGPTAAPPASEKPAVEKAAVEKPAVEKPAAPNPAFVEPRGDGFAIQVAALSGRAEAEGVAARLKSKGYAAYVQTSLPGQPSGYKVRVGKFKARAEAEQVAAKLEREEQFKPWITR